ncbi:MAG: hypothetical protein EHM45_12860 [Desulfobacteraceae bacterium]|nr:MAG: hypothetical protein EHM45_12860 [Desulfobacteraceae bacterium]
MNDRYVSGIPKDAVEKTVSEYKREGDAIWPKKTECLFNGEIVGERFYETGGVLVIERPMKYGKTHGVEYYWNQDGTLYCAEPYENGLPHGTAAQWDDDGNLIGTYTLAHGTGYDLWRTINENGDILISEIHSMKGGVPHGFEWWVNEDQESVFIEKHWSEGKLHGIERQWESEGKLSEGWPKYWINNVEVTKNEYVKASKKDSRLPVYLEIDQESKRTFPVEIQRIMGKC